MKIKELKKILESYPDDVEIRTAVLFKSQPMLNVIYDVILSRENTYFEKEKVLYLV